MDNLIIPTEYKVKWLDIVYLAALVGNGRIYKIEPKVKRELIQTYFDGLDKNKVEGFTVKELDVYNKPNLYKFLMKENENVIIKDKPKQRELKME